MQALPRLLWEVKHTHVSVTEVRLITAQLFILVVVLAGMSTLLFVLTAEYVDASWSRSCILVYQFSGREHMLVFNSVFTSKSLT